MRCAWCWRTDWGDTAVAAESICRGWDGTADADALKVLMREANRRVLRALGQDDELTVETGEQKLGGGKHAFLLCSDGFWEYVLEPEMEEDLAKAAGPEDWLERMRWRLRKRVPEDNDNNTAAAVWLTI